MLPLRPPGVSADRIAAAEARLGHALPSDLVEFWRISDGSEWIAFPEFGFAIYSLDTAERLSTLGPEDRTGPQRLVDVATDGARERFCYDPQSGQIVLIHVTWEHGEPDAPCAQTLTELVSRLFSGWDPWLDSL
jgi:hypothetical protein